MADTISIREYLAKEDAQLATWREREYIRLEIAMDYSEAYKNPGRPDAVGIAGLRWSLLSNRFDDAESNRLKAVLVSMLYAKVLNLDTANRSGLYGRVENVLRKVKESGGWSRSLTAFAKWTLSVPGSERHSIWPWTISDWDSVEARRPLAYEHVGDRLVCFSKTYTATLLGGPVTANAPSGLWLRLDVPDDELIRLLLPSVPLLAVTDFMAHANDDSQAFLAEMLFGVNQYHGAAERVRVGEEALAVGAAIRRLTQPTRSTDASSQAINQQQLTLAPADIAEAKLSQWLGEAIEWFRGLPSWQRITGVAGLMLLAVLVWNQTRDVGCPSRLLKNQG